MKYCQECKLDFPGSYRFCGSCGGELTDSVPCLGCGELAESRWKFCTSCGGQLLSESVSGPAVLPGPAEFADIPLEARSSSSMFGAFSSPAMTMAVAEQHSEKVTPLEWYAAPDLFEETTLVSAAVSAPEDPASEITLTTPPVKARPKAGSRRTAPLFTIMSAYGDSETVPPERQRRYGLLFGGLLLLIFFGLLGVGAGYWWTDAPSFVQSPPKADSTNASAAADSSSSSSGMSPTSSATNTSGRTTTSSFADEEFNRLHDRRISARPSESSNIIIAFQNAERKYPLDYRFPYERAKLSIKGIKSHHEAFGALAVATNKAIDNGKAQEMLDSLMADQDGDFYKLSRGHREWRTLAQALSNKDKKALSELHH